MADAGRWFPGPAEGSHALQGGGRGIELLPEAGARRGVGPFGEQDLPAAEVIDIGPREPPGEGELVGHVRLEAGCVDMRAAAAPAGARRGGSGALRNVSGTRDPTINRTMGKVVKLEGKPRRRHPARPRCARRWWLHRRVYEIGALRALDLLTASTARSTSSTSTWEPPAGSFIAALCANRVTPEEMMRVVARQGHAAVRGPRPRGTCCARTSWSWRARGRCCRCASGVARPPAVGPAGRRR